MAANPTNIEAAGRSAVEATYDHLEAPSLDPTVAHFLNASADRYRFEGKIGEGGMARVYRLRDLENDRDVALKVMKAELVGSARRRFLHEFNTIASVDHPYCLKVYEFGETEAGPYFTMELCPGQPLTMLAGRPLRDIGLPLVDVTLALDYIHARNIVHRDIKPSNILVKTISTTDGQRFEAKLMDFGLARYYQLNSSLTADGGMVGTPAYCAPEQIDRRELDHRADLYSLGLLAYELLSGGLYPFHEARASGQISRVLHAQLHENPRPLHEVNPEVPAQLSQVVADYVQKEPQRRPESAATLRECLCDVFGIQREERTSVVPDAAQFRLNSIGFVCRDREMEAIDAYLDQCLTLRGAATIEADAGPDGDTTAPTASVVAIVGEPGIGKSSVVRESIRRARSRACQVVETRCFQGNRAPFQPFVDIIRQILTAIPRDRAEATNETTDFSQAVAQDTSVDGRHAGAFRPAQPKTQRSRSEDERANRIRSILHDYQAELLRIAPDLRKWLPGEAYRQVDFDRNSAEYIFRAVATMFIELSTVQPIAICIDDLQWADRSSLDLIRHLCAGLAQRRATSRSDTTDAPRLVFFGTARTGHQQWDEFLTELQSKNDILTLSLNQLNSVETRELVALRLNCQAGDVDDSVIHTLDGLCRGNPFFVSEIIRQWCDTGRIIRSETGWVLKETSPDDSSLPNSVRDGLRSRLTGLSESARRLLAPAAIIGAVVDLDLLSDIASDTSESQLLDDLDELLQRRIFRENSSAARVEFAHDLLREQILEDLSPPRARKYHRDVARWLEAKAETEGTRVRSAVLAEHFRQAGDGAKAFPYFLAAAKEALDAYAFGDALHHLSIAEDLLPPNTDARQRFELYQMTGTANARHLRTEKAIAAHAAALQHAPDRLSRGIAQLGIAKLTNGEGKLDDGLRAFDAVLREIGCGRPSAFPLVMLDTAVSLVRFHLIPAWMTRITGSTDRERRREVACETLYRFGHLMLSRSMPQYVQICVKNAALSRTARNPAAKAMAYSKYAVNCAVSGLVPIGTYYARLAQRYANQCDRPEVQALVSFCLGAAHYCAGRLDQAERTVRDSLPALQRQNDSEIVFSHHWLRHIHSIRGDVANILASAQEELTCATNTDNAEGIGWAYYGLAHGLAIAGRHDEARDAVRESIRLLEQNDSNLLCVAKTEQGFARMQNSDFAGAVESLEEAVRIMRHKLVHVEIAMCAYPRLGEARLGPHWADPNRRPNKRDVSRASRMAFISDIAGRIFPNHHPHALRIRGRVAVAKGNSAKARRFFDRSIDKAEKLGARFDLARALLDSALAFPEWEDRYRRGNELLAELGATIPDVEREQLERQFGR